MEKNKILNRRLLYIPSGGIDNFLEILQQVDVLIEGSLNLEKLNSTCVVYGTDLKKFMIGREVVGNDPNLKHHELICIEDFNHTECVTEECAFANKEELLQFLSEKLSTYSGYRFSFLTLDRVEFVFFNLEK